jgi:hypothetical protein
MSTATVTNINGYIFHTSKNYETDRLAVRAALGGAKRKKIIVDEINFFICLNGVCNGGKPKGKIEINDYI